MALRGCISSQELRSSTRGRRTRSFSILPRRDGRVDAVRCSNGQAGLALAVVSLLGAFQLEMAKQAIASDSTYGSPPLEISVESLRYRDTSADVVGEDQTAAKRTAAGPAKKSSTTNKSKTAVVENDIAAKRKAAAARRMKQIQEGRTESPKASGLASSEGASPTISDAESLKMERNLEGGDGSKENVEARSSGELETSSREINTLEEKATAEKAAAEKAAAEKAAAEKAAAEKAVAEKAAAEKAAAEKAAAEKAAAEKAAAEKAAAEKAAAEKAAAEKAAAEKAAAEKAAAEKADLLKTKRQDLAAERAASLKKAADMAAAEREKAARKLISERSKIPSNAAKSPTPEKVVPSIGPSKELSSVPKLPEQEKETVKLAESKTATKIEFQKQEIPAESETARTLKETGLASTSLQSKSMKSSKTKSEISNKRLLKTNDESLIASSKKYEKYAKIVVNATEAAVLSIETISAVIVLRFLVSSIWKILKLALPVALILGFVALCMALM